MLKKRYVKSRQVAKVTFEFAKDEWPEDIRVESVFLVGDFNGWDISATPMSRGGGSAFRATMELEPGRVYQFRYLINGEQWYNEWHADRYVPNPFGSQNCVVETPASADTDS
jgi:1,4-alpha-glucan branching enzyme